MYTEEEARKLWCPYSRAQGQGMELSHNRPESSYNCIASECMAWRWAVMLFRGDGVTDGFETAATKRMAEQRGESMMHYTKKSPTPVIRYEVVGYCGASGEPS